MSSIDATLSTGESSDAVSGSFLNRKSDGNGTVTLQAIPTAVDDEFEVVLEGSAAKDTDGAEQWTDIGTFDQDEDERIWVVDITMGVRYRVRCVSGVNVRCVLVG